MEDAGSRAPRREEIDLLWAAASPFPDRERVAQAAERSDVGYVLETAAAHRVASLVLRSLKAAEVPVDPGTTWAFSHAKAREAHTALALPIAAEKALRPLAEAGLSPLLLKGLALNERYPAPGLRPMDDIDLLLPPALCRRAAAVLEQEGWTQGKHNGRDPQYDLAFRHPDALGVPLELHYQFIEWRERPHAFEAERLWGTRVPTEVFGQPAYVLPPEVELMTLIIHAAKGFHMFGRLLWAVDLVVATAATQIRWDEVARLASQTRRRVATAIALRHAALLGADVPEQLMRIAPVLERANALGALLDPARPFEPRRNPWWASYALVDSIAGKGKLAIGEFVRPRRNKRRTEIIGDLARLVYHGGPALARARFRSQRDS